MTLVREFHEAFGQPVSDYPTVPEDEGATLRLRIRLIAEEYNEAMEHLRALLNPKLSTTEQIEHLTELVKELADLRYVVDGTAVSLGLPIDAVFAEIHRANMDKLWDCETGKIAKKDPGGKVIKPPGWRAADISGLMGLYEGTAEET